MPAAGALLRVDAAEVRMARPAMTSRPIRCPTTSRRCAACSQGACTQEEEKKATPRIAVGCCAFCPLPLTHTLRRLCARPPAPPTARPLAPCQMIKRRKDADGTFGRIAIALCVLLLSRPVACDATRMCRGARNHGCGSSRVTRAPSSRQPPEFSLIHDSLSSSSLPPASGLAGWLRALPLFCRPF